MGLSLAVTLCLFWVRPRSQLLALFLLLAASGLGNRPLYSAALQPLGSWACCGEWQESPLCFFNLASHCT